MKRYIQSSVEINHIIEVILNFEPKSIIESSDKVEHPDSISKKHRLTDDQLRNFNDLVESMTAPLYARKFVINNECQSKKSYTYYIDFTPVDRDGNVFDDQFRMLFRASDHNIKHGSEGHVAEGMILKSFTLLGKKYTNPFLLQRKISDICNHLMDEDFLYAVTLDT